MKKLKLYTILSGIILCTSTMYLYGMEDDNEYQKSTWIDLLVKGVGTLVVGTDKVIRGHAPRLEEQLKTDTLDNNTTRNSHELDWAIEQIIESYPSDPLNAPKRLFKILKYVELQIAKDKEKNQTPKELGKIQVSDMCRTNVLAFLNLYNQKLQAELENIDKTKTFLANATQQSALSNNNNAPALIASSPHLPINNNPFATHQCSLESTPTPITESKSHPVQAALDSNNNNNVPTTLIPFPINVDAPLIPQEKPINPVSHSNNNNSLAALTTPPTMNNILEDGVLSPKARSNSDTSNTSQPNNSSSPLNTEGPVEIVENSGNNPSAMNNSNNKNKKKKGSNNNLSALNNQNQTK